MTHEFCLANAEECERAAAGARDERLACEWRQMAEHWRVAAFGAETEDEPLHLPPVAG
jgi:hypothetical protein